MHGVDSFTQFFMWAKGRAVDRMHIYMMQSNYIIVRTLLNFSGFFNFKAIISNPFAGSGKVVELAAKYQDSLKLDRIIDIWCSGKGVICLPIFHNITPAEAYTREAAIIDCLGVENLTNLKRGDYYGITKTWSTRDRKKLGVLLLYKAMHVFMVEGESQLRPDDIKKH